MNWEDLEQDLTNEEQRLLRRLLPRPIHIRLLGSPQQKRRAYERARRRVREQSVTCARQIEPHLKRLEEILEPARTRGAEIDDPDHAETIIEEAYDRLEQFTARLDGLDLPEEPRAFLTSEEQQRIDGWHADLDAAAAFFQTKTAFDQSIPELETNIEAFRERLAPYREFEQYLSQPERRTLDQHHDRLRTAVQRFEQEIVIDVLAPTDQERIVGLRNTLTEMPELLDGYNDRFVERCLDTYDELFSNIDAAGNDLNRAQREAIVRNDVRNLVVAAAGTGKTLALTYRVAYLAAEGVDPARIAALTYTRQAAREMETRLSDRFDIESADVRTLHSFAYRIAQETSDEHLDVADTQDLYNLIDRVIREARRGERPEFMEAYTQFLFHYDHTHLRETDFESRAEYVAERKQESYETLAGETVASRAEQVIADFLFTHDVSYQYEAVATWADSDPQKSEYRPDFYLPEYDLYIEHWGLDENAEVAPWFEWSSEQYREKVHWAQRQFADSRPSLLETFEFEFEAGRLEAVLDHRLQQAGVELNRLDFNEFVDEAFEYNEKERDIKESLASFAHNAKTFDISSDEARARLTRQRPRQYYFGLCGALVLEAYNEYLDRSGLVDFDDMITDATAAIRANPEQYRAQYDHILIDEFQDISRHQQDLLRVLAGADEGPRLFCVGDDWQSIYAFQGADVQQFIDFEEVFGPATRTNLTKNYRCPETVLQAGNDLIARNTNQIEKRVEAVLGHDCDPTLHVLDGYTDGAYERRVGQYTADLVEEFLARTDGAPGEVMVLCRYDAGAPFTDRVKEVLAARDVPYDGKDDHYRPAGMADEYDAGFDPDAGVSVFSVHQAKGRQAKQVIVVNVVSGRYGFPAGERESSLVAPVQDIETATMEEERRLFYVALTRTQSELHVLTRAGQRSPFIEEIEPYLTIERSLASVEPGEESVELTAKVERLWDDLHETQHQAGVLEDRSGTIQFVSWANESQPTVEEGVWYHFEDIEIGEFDGDPQVVLRRETTATPLYEIEDRRT